MATLDKKHKSFIVRRLACFDTPTQVANAVKEEFNLDVSRAQVNYYNPTTAQGSSQLAEQWTNLFNETREQFRKDIKELAIANKAYRLKKLTKYADKLEGVKNFKAAAEMLEQAAKEVGEAYTNKNLHEHTGKGGGPIETKSNVHIYLPDNGRDSNGE